MRNEEGNDEMMFDIKERGNTVEKDEYPVFNGMGYYYHQLRKFSLDYLSPEEIRRIYSKIKTIELTVLSIFYFMDDFFLNLDQIREKLQPENSSLKKIKDGESYSKEKYKIVTRIF